MSNLWRSGRVLVLVVTVLAVAACGPAAQPDTTQAHRRPSRRHRGYRRPSRRGDSRPPPQPPVAPPAAPGKYVEPAFLADRVKAGKLPPIEQRLPKEPFVIGPGVLIQEEYMKWENGEPGGDLNVAATFPSGLVYIGFGATILRSPSQTTQASLPNVVSEFTHSDDYTMFHFKIRDGLKWSDGEPVTTEDVRFAFEDMYGNPDVQKPFPTELYTQGQSPARPGEAEGYRRPHL